MRSNEAADLIRGIKSMSSQMVSINKDCVPTGSSCSCCTKRRLTIMRRCSRQSSKETVTKTAVNPSCFILESTNTKASPVNGPVTCASFMNAGGGDEFGSFEAGVETGAEVANCCATHCIAQLLPDAIVKTVQPIN
jgi:hypothetical protein